MKRPRFKQLLAVYLIVAGIAANVFVIWMAAGWPIVFDRWLIVSEEPKAAESIVCLAGGLDGNNIPSEDGWHRIYTAVQLWFDGYAPKIVFTGGGTSRISESEVYAEFAQVVRLPGGGALHRAGRGRHGRPPGEAAGEAHAGHRQGYAARYRDFALALAAGGHGFSQSRLYRLPHGDGLVGANCQGPGQSARLDDVEVRWIPAERQGLWRCFQPVEVADLAFLQRVERSCGHRGL